MNSIEIVQRTKSQISELTGFKTDTVSGIRRNEQGWTVTIEMVEMKRIPDTSDVIGTYEVTLDGAGDIATYERTGRYHRGQV
ncbi:MAG: gas vesicle protein [Roseiflexaceae bacterium]|nr:gas vesicle protein [Roseiflexaceae bacterium]